jgi:1-acyl-sn-glycerol-3-phosphate acyltransferase
LLFPNSKKASCDAFFYFRFYASLRAVMDDARFVTSQKQVRLPAMPPHQSIQNTPTHKFIRGIRWVRLFAHIAWALTMAAVIFPRVTVITRAHITQRWSAKLLRLLNIVLSIHGARPADAARNLIIVSNHVSWLDIFVINAAQPSLFVAKSEIRDWPLAGWLCEKSGTIFVRRAKRSDTGRINDEMRDALATGATVGLFPEGTTTAGDRLLKFHSSLFEPAVANAAIVGPVAIRYLTSEGERNDAAAYHGDIGFSDSIRQIISQKSMIAEITFAPPISAAGITRRQLAQKSEAAIAAILDVPIPDQHQRFGAAGE